MGGYNTLTADAAVQTGGYNTCWALGFKNFALQQKQEPQAQQKPAEPRVAEPAEKRQRFDAPAPQVCSRQDPKNLAPRISETKLRSQNHEN